MERTNRQRLADDENAREEQAAKGARKLAEDDERDVEKKSSGKSNLPSNPTAERCNARTTLKSSMHGTRQPGTQYASPVGVKTN